MAAIGAIRKHGTLLVVIIGIALLAFLVGDFSKLTMVLSDKNTVVKVNGKKVDDDYRMFYNQNSSLWRIFYNKTTLDEADNTQVHNFTWDQTVTGTMVTEQLEELGLAFSQAMKDEIIEEMKASLGTATPNQMLSQLVQTLSRTAPVEEAIGLIMNIEDYRDNPQAQELYGAVKAIERMTIMDAERQTYLALANNSLIFSDELAKQLAANNTQALAAVATLNVNAPAFKNINPTVTESEMKEYFNNNENQFELMNDTRDIDVVMFPVAPSMEDKKAIEDSVRNEYTRFAVAPSIEAFNINEMLGMVDSSYYKREDITIDTLQKLIFDAPVGTLIQPINIDEQVWYYGKTYDAALRPDSILIAYLVVDYKTPGNELSTRTKEEAQTTTDSLMAALKTGAANIFELTPDYLGGRQAADTTLWMTDRGTSPALYDSLMNVRLYSADANGAFVIYQAITNTLPVEKRRFALYNEPIVASPATTKAIRNQATQMLSESTTAAELVENANKAAVQVIAGKDVTNMMSSVGQLTNCREIVSWAFHPETEVDNLSDVVDLAGTAYAVAAVSKKSNKEDFGFDAVKTAVEDKLIALKKVEMIRDTVAAELAKNTDIRLVAQKFGTQLTDSAALTFNGDQYQNRGIENVALPAVFAATANETTIVLGNNNAYLVNVYNTTPAGEPSETLEAERNAVKTALLGRGRSTNDIFKGFTMSADILDQRNIFYN